MDKRLHTIAETEGFLTDCAEAGVSERGRAAIVDAVAYSSVALQDAARAGAAAGA